MGDWKGNKSCVTSLEATETEYLQQNRQGKGQPCRVETVMVIKEDNLKTKNTRKELL